MQHALATHRILGPFPLVSLAVMCCFAAGTYFIGSRGGPEATAVAQPSSRLAGPLHVLIRDLS